MSQTKPLDFRLARVSARAGEYYRHSGQITLAGVLIALIAGCLVGGMVGAAYSAAVVFIPFVKLRAIACLCYGLVVGVVPATVLKRLKVRNLPVSLLLVGVVTLVSYYISWASWEAMAWRNVTDFPTFNTLVARPKAVFNIAKLTLETGTWSLEHSDPLKGIPLECLWVTEALCVFGCSLMTARSMLHQAPFCEKCEQWCAGPRLLRTSGPTELKELKTRLEAKDFDYVSRLPAATGSEFIEFNLHQCEKCKELNTLTVVSRVLRKDRKGRIRSNQRKTVLSQLLISNDDLEKLSAVVSAAATASVPKPIKSH